MHKTSLISNAYTDHNSCHHTPADKYNCFISKDVARNWTEEHLLEHSSIVCLLRLLRFSLTTVLISTPKLSRQNNQFWQNTEVGLLNEFLKMKPTNGNLWLRQPAPNLINRLLNMCSGQSVPVTRGRKAQWLL